MRIVIRRQLELRLVYCMYTFKKFKTTNDHLKDYHPSVSHLKNCHPIILSGDNSSEQKEVKEILSVARIFPNIEDLRVGLIYN